VRLARRCRSVKKTGLNDPLAVCSIVRAVNAVTMDFYAAR